jgi:hypothetical protein
MAVITFAMIVPAMKVICLGFGEYWRKGNPNEEQRARAAIVFVQYISKWACPDMFAYILLLFLMRNLPDHAGGLIDSPAKLDVGFTCFSIFCVLSTFSSLAIVPPPKSREVADADDDWFRSFSPKTIFYIAVAGFAVFLTLLFVGLGIPAMGLDVNENAFLSNNGGPIPFRYKPILHMLNLSSMLNARCPVWAAVLAMARYAYDYGEGNCILALIMLFIFAIVLPIVSMICIVLAAWGTADGGPNKYMPSAKVVSKIAMLDVLCMGVLVVCVCASMYKSMGIDIYVMTGLYYMIGAEIVHYVIYYFVNGCVEAKQNGAGVISEPDPAK